MSTSEIMRIYECRMIFEKKISHLFKFFKGERATLMYRYAMDTFSTSKLLDLYLRNVVRTKNWWSLICVFHSIFKNFQLISTEAHYTFAHDSLMNNVESLRSLVISFLTLKQEGTIGFLSARLPICLSVLSHFSHFLCPWPEKSARGI